VTAGNLLTPLDILLKRMPARGLNAELLFRKGRRLLWDKKTAGDRVTELVSVLPHSWLNGSYGDKTLKIQRKVKQSVMRLNLQYPLTVTW